MNGGILGAVQEALRQIGLSADALSTTSDSRTNSSSSTGSTDTADTTGNVSTARKALYTFIHDLFTTMLDQSNGTSGSATYSYPMTTSLKDIIQVVGNKGNPSGNNTASAQTTDLSNLQSDFHNLVAAIGGDATIGSSSASLQEFLQNLERNLNQQGGSSINFVNTTA
jgi:hypothetical protein